MSSILTLGTIKRQIAYKLDPWYIDYINHGSNFMRTDRDRAVKMRKDGKSYGQINAALGIPKSTLSFWLKDLKLSEKAKAAILKRGSRASIDALVKRNKKQTALAKERSEKILHRAKTEALDMARNPLFLAGVSLYWAEGYKKGAYGSKWKSVDFANSDPDMVRLMMHFFRNICRAEDKKIKIQILAHPNVNLNEATKFWSKTTKIPSAQFIKSHCSSGKQGKRNKNSLPYGTVHLRINDVKLFFTIIGWIEGLKDILAAK